MKLFKSMITVLLILTMSFSFVIAAVPGYAAELSDEIIITDAENVVDVPQAYEEPTVFAVPQTLEEPMIYSSLDAIEQFVARLYLLVLGRPHDTEGLRDWSEVLRNGWKTGAEVAYDFFFSREFLSRPTNNNQYIDILYRTLLNRAPDPVGRVDWVNALYEGWPREHIFANFVHSIEFDILCTQAGIERGTYTPPPGALARVFVTRLYITILERPPDAQGLADWTYALVNGYVSGASIAHRFVFSHEMALRNLEPEQFVEVLYNSMLGRKADAVGLSEWSLLLRYGASREGIFASFVNSLEFDLICKDYGIVRGDIEIPPVSQQVLFAYEVHRLTNIERARFGVHPLGTIPGLIGAAQLRTVETTVFWSHTRPDGRDPFTVLPEFNVSFRWAGENIAWGQTSPAMVVQGWMNSPGHRANMLNTNFNNLGVGVVESGSRLYWVQLFTD